MHLEAEIKLNLEMHLEAAIERVWRCIWRPRSYNSEMHSEAVVVGKRLPPLQSHAIEWARDWVRVIAALHHAIDKVEKPSLDGIRHHDSDLTNHVPIIISSLSFSVLFLSSSQSTISLRLLPPYAPRNETSIFVASYGRSRVRSPDPGFPPHRDRASLEMHVQAMIEQDRRRAGC